jgi:hypothetical protein
MLRLGERKGKVSWNTPRRWAKTCKEWDGVSAWEIMPLLLLLLFSLALSIGIGILVMVIRRVHAKGGAGEGALAALKCPYESVCVLRRPGCWLAVKTRSLSAVQTALGLHNPKPCSLTQGFSGEEKLFIAPPVKGWVLVSGSGLPDPGDDVDACFRFVVGLSRKLGQVQFFSASRVLHHHAWVKADRGRVIRAYAWAGRTIWHQGLCTTAEKELEVHCFDYTESADRSYFAGNDLLSSNVDKVPLLAARWSLDPGCIVETECGIAGELAYQY